MFPHIMLPGDRLRLTGVLAIHRISVSGVFSMATAILTAGQNDRVEAFLSGCAGVIVTGCRTG